MDFHHKNRIINRPESALATIRAIDTTTLTTKKLRAHYALLHAMALDESCIDMQQILRRGCGKCYFFLA
jgi:hypothetical protein